MVLSFKHQPLKGIYLAYQLLGTLFIRVPWWILRSTFRSVKCITQLNDMLLTALLGVGALGGHGAWLAQCMSVSCVIWGKS
jgi:hypothetical protein